MSEQEFSFANLNAALLTEFPNLRDMFADRIGNFTDWEPGEYVLFGSVFTAYMKAAVLKDVPTRQRIADFIERMAASSDEAIEELLRIEVFPDLLNAQESIDAYWPHLGKRTQRLLLLWAPLVSPNVVIPPQH